MRDRAMRLRLPAPIDWVRTRQGASVVGERREGGKSAEKPTAEIPL